MKILILGGNGMIGHKMYQILSSKYDRTWVLFKKSKQFVKNIHLFNQRRIIDNFDLCNFDKLTLLLNELMPDILINASGVTIRRGIYDNILKTININSVLPHYLNNWVLQNKKKLIHFSTDCVFTGKSGNYTEYSLTDAFDIYGKTKSLGEIISSNTLTLRGSMIGRELENKTELLEWTLKQSNKTILGYEKAIYSGITTTQMADFILRILTEFPEMNGVYNVSSEPISKLELIKLFNIHFKIGANIECENSYVSDKSLNSTKFYTTTGFIKPNWNDLMIDLIKDDDSFNKFYQ